ncbi:MAG: PIG-L deacetylase family protein [Egibacteraceae bacterium]
MMTKPSRILLVSPHLDDGTFSCGQLLAAHPGATVMTVMAGIPRSYPTPVTRWDAAAGFREDDDVVGARREEDQQALELLDAQPFWLDFIDQQYRRDATPYDPADLACALDELIVRIRPDMILAPLGLGHPDHRLTHLGVRQAMVRYPGLPFYLYAEAIYRQRHGLVEQALRSIQSAGGDVRACSMQVSPDTERKRRAVVMYSSQISALEARARAPDLLLPEILAPERYWRLTATEH